jgi:Arc/MetJ family transcription regulator
MDKDVLTEARKRSRARGLSAYVNDAVRRAVLAERLSEYLDQLDHEFGPVSEEDQKDADAVWAGVKGSV